MNYSQKVKLETDSRVNITDSNEIFDLDFNFCQIDKKRNLTNIFFGLNFDSINNHENADEKLEISDYIDDNVDVSHVSQKKSSIRRTNLNELMSQSNEMMEKDFFSLKLKFKKRLKEMKAHTENLLENIRNNFNTYVDDQKSHLFNSFNTIENLFDLDSSINQCENEKIRFLEKKMTALSHDINGLMQDLLKFTK